METPPHQEPNDVSNNTSDHVTDFIDQANNTQKRFGHNKFQLQIEELEQEIEKWKLADREKDMKVALFRKTIATLQSQLQEKSNTIINLENLLAQHPDTQGKLQLQNNNKTALEENALLTNQLNELQHRFDNQVQAHLQLQQEIEQHKQSMVQSASEIELLKGKLHQHNTELVAAQQEITSLTDQLKMKTNLLDLTVDELQVVKQELTKLRSTNEELVNEHQTVTQQLQETEHQLHKQLDAAEPLIVTENNNSPKPNIVRGGARTVSRRVARREQRQG